MKSSNSQLDFEIKCLVGMLLLTTGLCGLLVYRMYTIPAIAPEQLDELHGVLDEGLADPGRKKILTQLFDVIEQRENKRQELRDLVLGYSCWMLVLMLTCLAIALRAKKAARSYSDE
jgi:hypothetical protein